MPSGGFDVTEQHFAFALGFFAVVTPLGAVLAFGFRWSLLDTVPVSRAGVVGAHATLAVFGAVLTTVLGALYQLSTMFTQTELHGVDVKLRRVESVVYPAGVVVLAVGRLVEHTALARFGGTLVVVGVLAFCLVLGRRLSETQVDWTPMLSRYAVLAGALALWAILALLTWVDDPLSRATLLGAPGGTFLLVFGVVGFVVFGTLYHVVPFIVWIHRYSDRLGLEQVPMIDDLYDDGLAFSDFWLLVVGTGALSFAGLTDSDVHLVAIGFLLTAIGAVLFSLNLLLVVHRHSADSLPGVFLGSLNTPDSSR